MSAYLSDTALEIVNLKCIVLAGIDTEMCPICEAQLGQIFFPHTSNICFVH